MKIRELLQIELWSKETSRKLLVGFGIVFGLTLLSLLGWYEVEVHWLTKGELEAARVALTSAEELENAGPLSEVELDFRKAQLEVNLKAAEKAAQTIRDNAVEMSLWSYVAGVELEREKSSGRWHTESNDQSRRMDALLAQLIEDHRKALHRVLD